MRAESDDYEDICVMIYSMYILHCRGIPLLGTVTKSLENLMRWHETMPEKRGIPELMELQLQAYVNMGRALDTQNETIRRSLRLLGKSSDEFRPRSCFAGKRIKPNRSQVRSMLGKWRVSRKNPMTAEQVADDIISRVTVGQQGRWFYKYYRTSCGGVPDIYELVIGEKESYFYDMSNFKFYMFDLGKGKNTEELRDDSYFNSG